MIQLAHRIVNRFIADLTNRKGFDNLWDNLGQGTRDEIRNEWINIVETVLENDKSC
jgi:hypothetical protein